MRTRLCDLLDIEVPIVQAGMSVYTSPMLAAAVSNAGRSVRTTTGKPLATISA